MKSIIISQNNMKICSFLHGDFIQTVELVEKFVKNIIMGL